MRITVFGASGKVGRRVVELALTRGHTVVAVIHEHNIFIGAPHVIIKKADIYNQSAVSEAIENSGAVISCLGSWGTKKRDVVSSAMRTIIPAMEAQKVSRIITLTGTGALAPGEPDTGGHTLVMKLTAPFPAGKVFADGEMHMQLLSASTLDWTTIRSPIMKQGKNTDYYLDLQASSGLATICREAVAVAILDTLEDSKFIQAAPIIHTGRK